MPVDKPSIIAIVLIAFWALALATGITSADGWITNSQGVAVDGDYMGVYTAGKFTLQGEPLAAYDWERHESAQHELDGNLHALDVARGNAMLLESLRLALEGGLEEHAARALDEPRHQRGDAPRLRPGGRVARRGLRVLPRARPRSWTLDLSAGVRGRRSSGTAGSRRPRRRRRCCAIRAPPRPRASRRWFGPSCACASATRTPTGRWTRRWRWRGRAASCSASRRPPRPRRASAPGAGRRRRRDRRCDGGRAGTGGCVRGRPGHRPARGVAAPRRAAAGAGARRPRPVGARARRDVPGTPRPPGRSSAAATTPRWRSPRRRRTMRQRATSSSDWRRSARAAPPPASPGACGRAGCAGCRGARPRRGRAASRAASSRCWRSWPTDCATRRSRGAWCSRRRPSNTT